MPNNINVNNKTFKTYANFDEINKFCCKYEVANELVKRSFGCGDLYCDGGEYRANTNGQNRAISVNLDEGKYYAFTASCGGALIDLAQMLYDGGDKFVRTAENGRNLSEFIAKEFGACIGSYEGEQGQKRPNLSKETPRLLREPAGYAFTQETRAKLHNGAFCELARQILDTGRGLKPEQLPDCVGFVADTKHLCELIPDVEERKTIYFPVPCFVFWDDRGAVKAIKHDTETGKRSKDKDSSYCRKGYSSPHLLLKPTKAICDKLLCVEGEFDAIAAYIAGFNAINLKPESGFMEFVKQHGFQCVAAYDADDTGRELQSKAIKQGAGDIGELCNIWGEGCDISDYLRESEFSKDAIKKLKSFIDNAKFANNGSDVKMAKDNQKTQDKPTKFNARAFCNDYFTGWTYDKINGMYISPNGEEMEGEKATSLCMNADITCSVSSHVADDVLAHKVRVLHAIDSCRNKAEMLADKYDGVDYIGEWCNKCGFDQYESKRIKYWLLAMIANGCYKQGLNFDNLLAFLGKQRTGKTSFFNVLSDVIVGKEANQADINKLNSKDTYIAESQGVIHLIDEIDKIKGKRQCADLKAFITTRSAANIRGAYERSTKTIYFRTVLGATANRDFIPADDESARRFWCVLVTSPDMFIEDYAEKICSQAAFIVREYIKTHGEKALKRHCELFTETPDERAETIQRNSRRRADDNVTLAIVKAAQFLATSSVELYSTKVKDIPMTLREWAMFASTGEFMLEPAMARFTPINAKAEHIKAYIKARCEDIDMIRFKKGGRDVRGYTATQLLSVFNADEQEALEVETPATQKTDDCEIREGAEYVIGGDDEGNPFINPYRATYSYNDILQAIESEDKPPF